MIEHELPAFAPVSEGSTASTQELKEAERALRADSRFRRWFHRVYKADEGIPKGGEMNPDLDRNQILDAFQEWVSAGRPGAK